MILFMMIIILVMIFMASYAIRINKHSNSESNKNKILKIIIAINIMLICILKITSFFTNYINIYGFIIFVFVNAIILVFSEKLSKNKINFIITIIVYFTLISVIPVYKFENHKHVFNKEKMNKLELFDGKQIELPEEKIEEYTAYYNCYNIKLLEKTSWK